jgi:hypothetical protein
MIWLVLGCRTAVEAPSLPAPGHANEWDALVAAAERGDLATIKVLARDFSLGDVAEDHPSVETIGGAMGFLQTTDDPEDLAPTIARAEAACTACHAARGVR